ASAIAKHAAHADAISSSGLVFPFGSSAREGHDTSSGPNAPLPTSPIVPLPFIRSPCQTTSAVRSVATTPSPPLVGLPVAMRLRARALPAARESRLRAGRALAHASSGAAARAPAQARS